MKKKNTLLFLLLPVLLAACEKGTAPQDAAASAEGQAPLSHGMIVLGEKLENPYKTENIRKAYTALYPTKSPADIQTTHLYARFLPSGQADFDRLMAMGLQLTDYPVDYRIVRDGDYYHDPALEDGTVTWQYAVVKKDFVFPADIPHELLDECFLSENASTTRAGGDVDWDAVEREAFVQTGNGNLLGEGTRAAACQPSGRITIVDPDALGGKPVGVSGVQVMANIFVKFSTAQTDRDGYYVIPKTFSSNPHYHLVFHNSKGFNIGFNWVLVPASVSTLGVGPAEGIDHCVSLASDRELFTRSVVNNAAYDYFERCAREDLNLQAPPADVRFWMFHDLDCGSAVMLHSGAVVDEGQIKKFLGVFSDVIKFFAPDITIGTKGIAKSFRSIYSMATHELAHASHFAKVGAAWWTNYISYILTSWIKTGGMTYGTGTEANAGYCEIGEMWAYYLESKLFYQRYGGTYVTFGTSNWFYPQILYYLEERGLSASELFAAFTPEVMARNLLEDELKRRYPARLSSISSIFNRYRK